MYGLPDSAILGTAKRLKGRKRRRSSETMSGLEILQELLHAGYVLYTRYRKTHPKKK